MTKHAVSNIKLGVFVVTGLLFLILLLYMIGKNDNLFGSTFPLKAHFGNVQGLTSGNNVRYAGIQAGTVKKVRILNDTLIEVVMQIETKMKGFIRKNAVASVGTDGLMGNHVINITPATGAAPLVEENDILPVKKMESMDDMLQTLARTNEDVAVIASQLKSTVSRINSSTAVWDILDDKALPVYIRTSLINIRSATGKANRLMEDFQQVFSAVKEGKGSLGTLLTDTSIAVNLQEALRRISQVGADADSLAHTIHLLTRQVQQDLEKGGGPANAILKDSLLTRNIRESLANIREGTDGFNEIMEAMKHSFLFRGYFRKQEKLKKTP
jgi:phospholipid/cholesterol/gamma-HCH transport system substrate-binding protein